MKKEIFRMERVTYREDEVTLLEDFNIRIYQGEILGLLPVNGHGLPAFLKLLETNLPLHDGYIYYGGERINSWKESRRTPNRISVIGAQNRLVEALSVTDNIFVLRQGFRQEIVRTGLLKKQLAPFLEDIGMDISADVPVERLPAFERVVLELLRAVVLGCRLIVLNEIGMLISYEELEKLHIILRHYAKQGFSFLYICPHYEEVAQICEKCALLSHGRILKIVQRDDMMEEILKLYTAEYERMVRYRLEKRAEQPPKERRVFHIPGLRDVQGRDISAAVYEDECLAVQILENDVFLQVCDMLLGSESFSDSDRRARMRRGRNAGQSIAVVPELATKTMLFPGLSYMENLCISLSMRVPSLWREASIRRSIMQEYGETLGPEVFHMPVEELSERQKYQLIYTRILLGRPDVVFCIQPFKGADLSHRMFIWKMLEMLLNHGIAVVMLTLSLSDSLSLADRLIIVGKDGGREILRKDFAAIPEIVPWMFLYRE